MQVGNGSVDALIASSSVLSSVTIIDLTAFVVPITVAVFNLAIPKLVQLTSAHLEQWDSAGTALKMDLWRMYLCKVINSAIAIFGKMLLADPYFMLTSFMEYELMHSFIATFRAAVASAMTFKDSLTMKADQTTVTLVDTASQSLYSSCSVDSSCGQCCQFQIRDPFDIFLVFPWLTYQYLWLCCLFC